jgi:hypothetical protein
MPSVIRHDAITLNSGVKPEDFEKFMGDELIPSFSEIYRGPTRASKADIKGQSLLKDAKGRRKYLWVTVWDGNHDSVQGAAFQNARMNNIPATSAMLKKLEAFGSRTTEKIFDELVSVEVDTNR